jgi:hypothetical protein
VHEADDQRRLTKPVDAHRAAFANGTAIRADGGPAFARDSHVARLVCPADPLAWAPDLTSSEWPRFRYRIKAGLAASTPATETAQKTTTWPTSGTPSRAAIAAANPPMTKKTA